MTGSTGESAVLGRAIGALHRVEDAFLALLLGAMVVLAPLQIFLRIFFDAGLTWADPLLRVLVLWVGLFGAISASRGDRHISIDAFSRVLPEGPRAFVALLVHVFTSCVCAVVAWHSWRFVQDEREFGAVAFLGVPVWVLELVLPFAFAVMAIRYLVNAGAQGMRLAGLREGDPRPAVKEDRA